MSKPRKQEAAQTNSLFQFTLTGLIIFSLALMGGASFITYKLGTISHPQQTDALTMDMKDQASSAHAGPWGELVTHDISLERPVEYLTEEVAEPQPEIWTFTGQKPEAVKTLLQQHGLSATQVATLFATGKATENRTGTVLQPAEDFLLSLSPETRRQLFTGLAGLNVNLYIDYPYIFPGGSLDDIYLDTRLNPEDVALLKHLIYSNGSAQQLSDYQALLNKIPTPARRVALTSALSRQSAVLARLMVRPNTDIDKIASYWSNVPNVRFTDLRPLLESLKQLPEGGTISLLYLLPKFARDRLYTFPLPPQPGEPTMDCHWTTFNFSNETPDNRFNDPEYAVRYIQKNYYPIAAPSQYGDILLLMNDKNEVKHSAVYLADNIVFTKNGNNYRQPWMLMRIPDLLATYPSTPPMRPIYMRHQEN
jgi:hypothetical protein